MNKLLMDQITTPELRKRAWDILVKELGIVDALRFVMATEMGNGDSTQEYQKMWNGKSMDEIYEFIRMERNKQNIRDCQTIGNQLDYDQAKSK